MKLEHAVKYIKDGNPVNELYMGRTILHCVWYERCEETDDTVRFLLEKGADPNIKDVHGQSPFYLACFLGTAKSVELMLEKGADVHMTVSGKWTPLFAASADGQVEIVKLLIKHGAEINIVDHLYRTPLYLACQYGFLDTTRVLIENGASVKGRHHLIRVCLDSHSMKPWAEIKIIRLLLENGIGNDDGESLYCACKCGRWDVVNLLIEFGAIITKETADEFPRAKSLYEIRRAQISLCLIRSHCPESMLADDHLPRDMFDLIMREMKLIA